MRRGFSIFLLVLFGLGPLAAAVEASSESSLPACCRRHGEHHCAMPEWMARQLSGSGPAFTAPPHCPLFPVALAASMKPAHALAASSPGGREFRSRPHTAAADQTARRLMYARTRASRGPPASLPD